MTAVGVTLLVLFVLPVVVAFCLPDPRGGVPWREARRDPNRPATIKPKKAPATITPAEHVVIADAVRLLGWGRQWHELADMIARLSERPTPAEIRRVLKTYRDHIDAIATRRAP